MVSYQTMNQKKHKQTHNVLILIVVEDGLVLRQEIINVLQFNVLILIVVEDGLVPGVLFINSLTNKKS